MSSKSNTSARITQPNPKPNPKPAKAARPPAQAKTKSPSVSKPASRGARAEPMGPPAAIKSTTPVPNAQAFASGWLNRHNIYLSSLRDPVAVTGARIPDGATEQSSVFQMVYRLIVKTDSATGICGILVGYNGSAVSSGAYIIPQAGISCSIGGITQAGAHFLLSGVISGNSSTNVFSDSVAPLTGTIGVATPGLASFLSGYAQKCRLVSASINVMPAVATDDATGVYFGASLPANFWNGASLATFATLPNLMGQPGVVVNPIYNPKEPGLTLTYSPMDNTCLAFCDLGKTTASYTDDDVNALNPGVMYIVVDGEADKTHIFNLVFNYEIVKKNGVIGMAEAPNEADPLGVATTENARRGDPVAFVGSDMFSVDPGAYNAAFGSTEVDLTSMIASEKETTTRLNRHLTKLPELPLTTPPRVFLPHATIRVPRTLSITNPTSQTAVGKAMRSGPRQRAVRADQKPLFESLLETVGEVMRRIPGVGQFLEKI